MRESSGNVFEDLGVPASDEVLAKSEIGARIAAVIERRGLTQAKAASLLDVSQDELQRQQRTVQCLEQEVMDNCVAYLADMARQAR